MSEIKWRTGKLSQPYPGAGMQRFYLTESGKLSVNREDGMTFSTKEDAWGAWLEYLSQNSTTSWKAPVAWPDTDRGLSNTFAASAEWCRKMAHVVV